MKSRYTLMLIERLPMLVLLPKKSEEEVINNNGGMEVGNDTRKGNASVQRSNGKFRPPVWLGSLLHF